MTLRERMAGALVPGAFLRRDRGGALYISDAPRFGDVNAPEGFRVEIEGALARFYIKPEALEKICDEFGFKEDQLARELRRFKGASEGAARLFSDILKAMEASQTGAWAALDRRVRQAAAVAMRGGEGEGLYYCALALAEFYREGKAL